MPNVIARIARYITRSRKRSASHQSSSASSTIQNITSSPRIDCHPSPHSIQREKQPNKNKLKKEKSEAEKEDSVDANEKQIKELKKNPTVSDSSSRPEEEAKTNKQQKNTVTFKITSDISQSATVRNRRVMRELQYMTRATSLPNSAFEVNLVDDSNIFEWDVRLLKVDETSDLWKSMQDTGTESIKFRLSFPELFPFQPPFLRLVGPYLDNGFIMDGGAICMEVLTSQGWSSAYTIESLLVQVASGLTQGGAVVSRRQKRRLNQLSQRRAEVEFRRICKIHAKYGWVNMERDEA
ncbi:ubiquitin-conjugating enzyme E2Q-like protein 1 [Styela clava]